MKRENILFLRVWCVSVTAAVLRSQRARRHQQKGRLHKKADSAEAVVCWSLWHQIIHVELAGLRKDSSNNGQPLILNPSHPAYLPACANVSVSSLLTEDPWRPPAAGGAKSCSTWYVYLATEEKWQQRVIHLVWSRGYEGSRSFKFLIRLAVETLDFYRLIVWQGIRWQSASGPCFTKRQVERMSACVQSSRIWPHGHEKTYCMSKSIYSLRVYTVWSLTKLCRATAGHIKFLFSFTVTLERTEKIRHIWAFPVLLRCFCHTLLRHLWCLKAPTFYLKQHLHTFYISEGSNARV